MSLTSGHWKHKGRVGAYGMRGGPHTGCMEAYGSLRTKVIIVLCMNQKTVRCLLLNRGQTMRFLPCCVC